VGALKYELAFKPRVRKDLKALSSENTARVVQKIEEMRNDLAGDVKHLTNATPEYRLRLGDYRVLFQIEGNTLVIYRIVHRREAYR
jgi:mRNA interferase RelE/StbE